MDALGIDPKDADPNDLYFTRFDTFDESISDRDQQRLNTFPTTSNAIQIVTKNKYGDNLFDQTAITNNVFYDSMARKGADYDSFVDSTGRNVLTLSETSYTRNGYGFNKFIWTTKINLDQVFNTVLKLK